MVKTVDEDVVERGRMEAEEGARGGRKRAEESDEEGCGGEGRRRETL